MTPILLFKLKLTKLTRSGLRPFHPYNYATTLVHSYMYLRRSYTLEDQTCRKSYMYMHIMSINNSPIFINKLYF